jgi:hypothetical protein
LGVASEAHTVDKKDAAPLLDVIPWRTPLQRPDPNFTLGSLEREILVDPDPAFILQLDLNRVALAHRVVLVGKG